MTVPETPALPGAGGPALPAELTVRPLTGAVSEVGQPTPGPSQAPSGGFESWEVSPGLVGFVPVFLIALACVGLFLSLTRHLRRVTVRQALLDADDAASAGSTDHGPAARGAGGPAARPDGPGPGESPSDRR